MADTEGELNMIASLDKIYETEWRPACNKLFTAMPRAPGVLSIDHGIEVAKRSLNDVVFEANEATTLVTAGMHWLRLFKRFVVVHGADSEYLGAEGAGYCRAMNIWQLLFPMHVSRYARYVSNLPQPENARECFDRQCDSDFLSSLWRDFLRAASIDVPAAFSEKDMQHLLAAYDEHIRAPKSLDQ